jgi:hypothetical protein
MGEARSLLVSPIRLPSVGDVMVIRFPVAADVDAAASRAGTAALMIAVNRSSAVQAYLAWFRSMMSLLNQLLDGGTRFLR